MKTVLQLTAKPLLWAELSPGLDSVLSAVLSPLNY